MSDKTIKIAGRLRSVATNNIVAGADSILDDVKGKTQEDINDSVDTNIVTIQTEIGTPPPNVNESIHDRITQLRNDLQAAQIAAGTVALDETPTKGSSNFVNSGALFNKFSWLESYLTGELLPVSVVSGNRLNWSSDSNKGYYVATSGNSVYIFDVTKYKGKALNVVRRTRENTFNYAFVTDYTLIPSTNPDLTVWNSIAISGTRCNTTNGEGNVTENNYTVPSNEGNIFLCISCFTNTCIVTNKSEGVNYKIDQLQQNKQDVLTFDETPTQNSSNPVKSGGVFQEIADINSSIYGKIVPTYIKSGSRIVYASNPGYWAAAATQGTYIYDVTQLKGKTVRATWKGLGNAYTFVFVNDYTLIPNSYSADVWSSIYIPATGSKKTTDADQVLRTVSISVPTETATNASGNVYLCISFALANGCDAYDTSSSLPYLIEELNTGKQNTLSFDETPTENSENPVTSDGVYQSVKPLLGVSGVLTPMEIISGRRIVHGSTGTEGYLYSHAGASAIRFDVTDLVGTKLSIKATSIKNSEAYAFVNDEIKTEKDLERWADIKIAVSGKISSDNNAYQNYTVTVPAPTHGYNTVYLYVTQRDAYPIEVINLDAKVAPFTIDELEKLRNRSEASGNVTYLPTKLGLAPITSVKYDWNIIIGYGQSLAGGSGYQAEDLPQDDNAKMLYSSSHPVFMRYSSNNSYWQSAVLHNLYCTGNTSSTQDFPPNASATIDFAKLYRLKTGNTDKIFIHICPAKGSTTIAQLMDFERYKNVDTNEFYFPNLESDEPSTVPYLAFYRMLTRVKQLADAAGKTVGVIAVNWNQGEADYGGSSPSGVASTTTTTCNCNGDKAAYIARLKALHDDMWEDMQTILGQTEQPAWFIAQCSGSFVGSSFSINQALIDICDGRLYFQTHSTYSVPNKSSDGHPTGNGYRWYGEYLAKAMADVLLRNNQPELVQVKRIDTHLDNIKIYCNVPCPPLRTEINILQEMKNYGFSLTTTGGSTVGITSISVDKDVITIKPTVALSENTSYILEYATYNARAIANSSYRAEGNICDSDMYNANFTCMQEITTPEHTPLDENGESLVGKPYPLYNFLVPFKIQITAIDENKDAKEAYFDPIEDDEGIDPEDIGLWDDDNP